MSNTVDQSSILTEKAQTSASKSILKQSSTFRSKEDMSLLKDGSAEGDDKGSILIDEASDLKQAEFEDGEGRKSAKKMVMFDL